MEFVMTIGLSGSGKTTWAHTYKLHNLPCTLLDSDTIRGELYGDENCQDNPAKVFDLMYRRTCEALSRGESVCYCATNLSMKRRIHLLKQLRARFPETYFRCVVFNTPISVCKEWNNNRKRKVPEYVIDKQVRAFQFPVENEGWDKIGIVSPAIYETIRFSKQVWKDVDNAGNQDNPHHTLTLREHLTETIRKLNLSQMSDDDAENLIIAAGMHDIGKAYTRSYDDDGIAHYFGHDMYGAYIAMNMGASMETVRLVNYHMLPFNEQGIVIWRQRLGEELWNKIMILHAADVKAK